MEDYGDEKDDSKRKSRNASEKKRRDQFNILVTELGNMVSPGGGGGGSGGGGSRKMDKTTVLRSTISFLRQQKETSTKSHAHEIQEDWKPSFLSNEEFTDLMLEALEGFILVFTTDGRIIYASKSVTSLLGHLPRDLLHMSLYDLISESDKNSMYGVLSNACLDDNDSEKEFLLHLRKAGAGDIIRRSLEPEEETFSYELVKLSGHFRKWSSRPETSDAANDDDEDGEDGSLSVKSHHSSRSRKRQSNNKICGSRGQGCSDEEEEEEEEEMNVFVCIARLQSTQLLREVPLEHTAKNEFTSRYSLEWKFLFLDHRAPPIIGYLPFELLGTSGYDYYHVDDLERILQGHESLIQKGEGTSCCHRFLSKGQQWIWLQTRYFITYHQWSSKPEFVVATHKVVNYSDVLKELKGNNRDTCSEVGSMDIKSTYDHTTAGSPTWSSRSSAYGLGGGGGSSTGTAVSSRICNRMATYNSEDYFPNEYDNIGQYVDGGGGGGGKEQSFTRPSFGQENSSVMAEEEDNEVVGIQQQQAPSPPNETASAVATEQLQDPLPPALVATGQTPLATQTGLRTHVTMTAAQVQLQEQLLLKHTELTRRINEQQDELRRISEQLLMSQYGLVNATSTSSSTFLSSSSSFMAATVEASQPQCAIFSTENSASSHREFDSRSGGGQ